MTPFGLAAVAEDVKFKRQLERACQVSNGDKHNDYHTSVPPSAVVWIESDAHLLHVCLTGLASALITLNTTTQVIPWVSVAVCLSLRA